jgi:adenylate cyclase
MTEVNAQNRSQGLPELEMGIGLNETEAVVGNIGSSKRSKYAVVGSGVNMTSRIESYTVGGQILISESVYHEAGELLRVDSQREILPKGAETPIRIYEVGGIAGSYNLTLEKKDPLLVSLLRQIPIQCAVLEGKDIGKKGLKGSVVRLSRDCAEISLSKSLEVLTNLKMNLEDVDEKLSAKDIYGKIIESSGIAAQIHMIHFTSVPPEVDAYFQAHRQYGIHRRQNP